jgi:hypothetical protein
VSLAIRLLCAGGLLTLGLLKIIGEYGAAHTIVPRWLVFAVAIVECGLGVMALSRRWTSKVGTCVTALGTLFLVWIVFAGIVGIPEFGCGCLGSVELTLTGRITLAGGVLVAGGMLLLLDGPPVAADQSMDAAELGEP